MVEVMMRSPEEGSRFFLQRSLTPFDAGTARLTLVTSESIKGRARQVLYVDATLKGKALPPSTGRPSSIPVAEKQLQGDRRALIAVVAWLAALLLVAAVGSWGRSRWGRRQAVLVGLPVLVASLWGVAEAATHLLPNLF